MLLCFILDILAHRICQVHVALPQRPADVNFSIKNLVDFFIVMIGLCMLLRCDLTFCTKIRYDFLLNLFNWRDIYNLAGITVILIVLQNRCHYIHLFIYLLMHKVKENVMSLNTTKRSAAKSIYRCGAGSCRIGVAQMQRSSRA